MFKSFTVSVAFLFLVLSVHLISAQERVRVGWAAMTASHTPLWVAQDRGLFAKQGLVTEPIFFGAGPPAMQALVAGDLDIVITSAPNVVNPRLGGADLVMILSIIPTFIDHIISAANITTVEQLRGKTGSVNRAGSISDMGLKLSLKRLGIDPDKDVKIVPAGGNPERLASISRGLTQFTIMNEPFIKEAERLGFRDLVNMATLKIPLHGNGVVTREATIKARRPMVEPLRPRDDRSDTSRSRPTRKAPRRSSANTPGSPIPKGWNELTATTPRCCSMRRTPIPPASRHCLTTWRPRFPRPVLPTRKSFVDPSFVQEMEIVGVYQAA